MIIGVNFYFPHVSGLSEAARLLAEGLVADGLKIRVVCCRHRRDLLTLELIGSVEVERVPQQCARPEDQLLIGGERSTYRHPRIHRRGRNERLRRTNFKPCFATFT